jgi:hypothetical protein
MVGRDLFFHKNANIIVVVKRRIIKKIKNDLKACLWKHDLYWIFSSIKKGEADEDIETESE